MLSMKMAEYTNKQRAKISGDPLQEEQASVTLMFNAWYDRCTNLLLIEPVDQPASPPQLAHVAKADIERAVAVAESQEAEGDVHTRRLEEIARQLESLGVAKASDAEAAATQCLSHCLCRAWARVVAGATLGTRLPTLHYPLKHHTA